jgi:hypothetical protein
VSKPYPLISNEPLEASTTVEQGSVEIENNGANIRQHLFLQDTHSRSAEPLRFSGGGS